MNDLFEREQAVLDHIKEYLNSLSDVNPKVKDDSAFIPIEYERLLRQLKRITLISDKATGILNNDKQKLLDKINIDPLTNIGNRRFLEKNLTRYIKTLSRSGGFLTVMMVDIDFFKLFNDTYGHTVGDECLKKVAKAIEASVDRAEDITARYGGEEFTVVLPNTDKPGSIIVAQRIVDNIKALKIPHENSHAAPVVTVSVGVTGTVPVYGYSVTNYIKRADDALYLSKNNGRNQFTFVDFEEEHNDRP